MGSPRHGRIRHAEAKDAPREIELKLELAPGEIDGLLTHPILAQARPTPEQGGLLRAVYFDTETEALRQAGLSLRIRQRDQDRIQTIKAERDAKGLALDRDEWESPVEGERPDFAAAAGTALERFVADDAARERIRPVFTVSTDRKAYLVEQDDAAIELVLDKAEVAAGSRSRCFGEIELELKRGDPAALFRLALDLSQAVPLRLALATKSGRGYALSDRHPPKAVKAAQISLVRGTSSAEAFRIIARSCLTQMIENEAILRETRDPAVLHQMRVGLRRLRAAISLHKRMLADAESETVKGELRWISRRLGPARDLDVLIDRARKAAGPDSADDEILADAEQRRVEAYDKLLALLDRQRFRHAVLAAAAWIESGHWRAHDDPAVRRMRDLPIEQHAVAELSKRSKRVLKRAKRIAKLDPEARHRVRIAIKKLRYGVEFFQGLFPGKRAKEHRQVALKALEDLQERLGELNDIAVGGGTLLPARTAGCGAIARAAGDHEARVADLLAHVREDYRRLARTKPFWE